MNIFKNYTRLWMLLIASIMSCVAIAQDENYGIGDGFDPANPGNPGSNGWNAATGEVIIDDFTTGNLNNSITKIIGNSGSAAVTQIVVAGVINNTDFRVGNNYVNSTLVDFSRTAGISSVPSSAYSGNTHLCSIMLPTSITDIGSNAFNGCSALTAMTCYTLTPPKVGANAFSGVADGMVVYVPSEAVDRYIEADIWKDFTILPIQETVHSLTVKLPNDIDISTFKNMTLELVNAKSGQSYRYIITEKTSYVFNNLIENTVYKAYVKNNQNNIFGETSEISVNDTDAEVTFASLSIPQNINLSIMAGGNDITSQSTVTWTDSLGNYLSQGSSLSGYAIGKKLNYSIVLPQNIVMEYALPNTMQHVVAVGGNNIVCTLSPLQKVVITGKVLALTTKSAISGAVVSASQTFGGKYSKTTNVKTNNNGEYSIEIFRVPTSLAIAASDYVSQTVECDVVNEEGDNVSVSDVSLKSITGAVISLDFTYTKCPDNESEEGDVESYYSEYTNVDYTIFNKTQNRNVSQFNVQYPQIVLLEEVNENDILELTASSRTSAFVPVKATATIDAEQHANVTFDIVELGKLKSSFAANGNSSVVGSLYDANGKLLKTYDYSGNSLTVSALADGNYTLVTMGSSRLFNTIYDLSQLPQTGLTKDVDYAQNNVTIESGKLTVISIAEVPTLDESKLYYTGDNTSFTVNKTSIVAGNYLTLTGHLDFKSAYSTKVSNVNLIVDLPESCSFVENSVMVGNSTSSYTLDGNRVIIPMARYTDRVRFCIIPTLGGEYAPSALVQFDIEGETITQPIGSTYYTAEDLSIKVPSVVAKTTIPVSGTAIGTSDIEIYDNDVLVGQTKSLANGSWATMVKLEEPYNLSVHSIYAKVKTNQGLLLQSDLQECKYDGNAIRVSKVKMYHNNPEMHKNYEIIFDFINPTIEDQYYIYYIYNKVFTFTIEFTSNDTTRISNVILNVKTGNGTETALNATYDKKQDLWVATGEFGNMYDGNIPVNVSVDYSCEVNNLVDRDFLEDQKNMFFDEYKDNLDSRKIAIEESTLSAPDNTVFDYLNNILDADSIDIDNLKYIYKQFNIEEVVLADSLDDGVIDRMMSELMEEYNLWKADYSIELDSIIDDFYFNEELSPEMFAQSVQYNGIINYEMSRIDDSDIQLVINERYSFYQLTDSNYVYYKYDENGYDYIDVQNKIRYRIYREALNNSSKNSPRRANASNESVDKCANSIATTIQNIKNLYDNGNLSVKDAISQLVSLAGFFQCYYSAILINADISLTKEYDEAINEYNIKINKRENLKKISLNRIDNFTKELAASTSDKKYVDDLLAAGQKQLLNPNLSPEEFKSLSQKCSEWKQQSIYYEGNIKSYKAALKKENNTLAALVNQLDDLKKGKAVIEKAKANINKILAKLPKKIAPTGKLGKIISVGGKLAGFFGEVINVWSVGCDVVDALNELKEWGDLEDAIDRKIPCEKDAERALALQRDIHSTAASVLAEYIIILSAEIGGIASNLAGGVPGISLSWWLGSIANIYAEWAKVLRIEKYIEQRGNFWLDIMYLKCTGKEPDDPRKDKDKKRKHEDSNNKDSGKGIDPSGYVYEGVFSNRLEGVTATCYYKETVEDMYGDKHENIVKWDASEYAQENPLFTDENGYYRWDVPQGLWQVKFEKEGYETTYSEWLPVPPPQLDINIAMKQNVQPTVKSARAFEDAVEMEFDKYMMPELLTADNIRVMVGETVVEGTVELLNEEVSYEGNEEKYASKVRFNAAAPFDATEITLMVSNRVKSYAGIRMQDDFSQTFTIEPEVREIVCESNASVVYGNSGELTVQVLPAVASAGKTVKVKSSSTMILSTDVEELTLDSEGKASLTVNGELPGAAAITYSVDGYDLSATTMVSVEQEQLKPDSPVASVASGSALLKGSSVTLSCPTSGVTIYYTTDGSCPCDAGAIKYEGTPITVSKGMTLKAMAVGEKGDESNIATYIYTIRQTDLQIPLEKGWNWISHNRYADLTSEELQQDYVERVLTQTCEIYRDPKIGFTGNINDVSANDGIKVNMSAQSSLKLDGDMFNPYLEPVSLKAGWNWIGYPLSVGLTVDNALVGMNSEVGDFVVNINDGFSQYDGEKWIGTLNVMAPGKGYLMKSASDKEFIYNTLSVHSSKALMAKAGEQIELPWSVDVRKYPNVMCVTAELYANELKSDDGKYVVAAFVDGECRGIGKTIGDKVFLMVHGGDKADVDFFAFDTESGSVYDIEEKAEFTADIIGSVALPQIFHLGGISGINSVIYDNPGVKSIHNILGQKVKSIDRSGVYIIDGKKVVVTKKNENDYSK